ncbi:MAG TPA: cobalamin-binding protein [Bacteroidales bacterium]|jgi:5-methyltetrahydrofolate--homocysteine methyltransferase|nr:cobalamin-binding protein [Bacteroidales bacterium]
MEELIDKLAEAVEFGKVDRKSPYPPQLRDQDGALELTIQALEAGVSPSSILEEALIPAMGRVGVKFSENKIFVPQMLMSAKAMGASMSGLKPFFVSGDIKTKGTFIIGTVKGDLHDIGKNLVSMMIEGGGWTIVDLGVDVPTERFLDAIEKHPGAFVGLSALLTTTMANMEASVKQIKAVHPATPVLVGGAPVNEAFCQQIGADYYAPDPQGAVEYLNRNAS